MGHQGNAHRAVFQRSASRPTLRSVRQTHAHPSATARAQTPSPTTAITWSNNRLA